jgi:hypothetical protein
MSFLEPRRHAPRISVDGLCGVVEGRGRPLRHAAMVDLSWLGLRLELPFDHRTASRTVQLELELPALDEIIWARGVVTFAQLTPMGGHHADGQPRLWCRAGMLLDRVASRERDLLRDVVMETRRVRGASELGAPAWLRARARRRRWSRLRASAVVGAPDQVPEREGHAAARADQSWP